MKIGDAVQVNWLDSQSFTGWQHVEEAEELAANNERLQIESIGYLIHQSEFSITLAQSRGRSQFCQGITIPRCSIKAIKRVTP